MKKSEIRRFPVTKLETRKDDNGQIHVTGIAAPFNTLSNPLRTKAGRTFVEKIAPGAFAEALTTRSDIELQFEHSGIVMARTSAKTLSLQEKDEGLAFDAILADTTRAADLVKDIEHGNIRGMSFGFGDPTDEWANGSDGVPVRTLKKVPLGEVSFVYNPAYPDTTIDVRSIDDALAKLEPPANNPADTAARDDAAAAAVEKEVRTAIQTLERRWYEAYGASSDTEVRSACRRAQYACREAHDSMEVALHTISTRKNDPNEHETRAIKDMMEQTRAMTRKHGELKKVVKALTPDQAEEEEEQEEELDQQRSATPCMTREELMGRIQQLAEKGLPTAELRSQLASFSTTSNEAGKTK